MNSSGGEGSSSIAEVDTGKEENKERSALLSPGEGGEEKKRCSVSIFLAR